MNKQGLFWGFISYAMWGFFPVYWKLLGDRPALEILVQRMVWSFVFYVVLFLLFSKNTRQIFFLSRRDWGLSTLAAVLLTTNWGVYIYAVNTGHVLEGSLAYFINPILNVAVGVLFFKENFPPMLKVAVIAAILGVIARIGLSPVFPWLSLILAFTFCLYGVTKKMLKIPVMSSSVLESAVGIFPALIGVWYFTQHSHLPPLETSHWWLFIAGGIVSGLPLFLFSFAAQRVPYSVMGMIQFIAPTLQFIVGILLYHEAFGWKDVISFGLIWLGMIFYISHQIYKSQSLFRKNQKSSVLSTL